MLTHSDNRKRGQGRVLYVEAAGQRALKENPLEVVIVQDFQGAQGLPFLFANLAAFDLPGVHPAGIHRRHVGNFFELVGDMCFYVGAKSILRCRAAFNFPLAGIRQTEDSQSEALE